MRLEALHLGADAPEPFQMVEDHVRPVGKVDPRRIAIEAVALGRNRRRLRLAQELVQLRIAILAPIEEAVAGKPDRDVAVRIGPAAPDAEGGLIAALLALGGGRARLQRLDRDLE